jgi:hypothetical protein
MARTKNSAADPAADPDTGSDAIELMAGDVTDVEPTIEQQLDEFFGEPHSDVTCSIYELGGPRHDQRGFLFSFPFVQHYRSAELYEQLLESHGPGWYELSAQRQGGRGWVKRKIFQLGSERDRMRAALRKADPETARPEPAAASSGQLSPELRALIEGQNRILERLIDRPENDTVSRVREFAELRALFAPPERKETPIGEIFTLVKDVLALKNELADGDGDANPLAAALKQFAPAINSAVERLGADSARATPAQPRPGSTVPGGADLNGSASPQLDQLMNINALFAELHRRAEADEKAPEVADAVLVYLAERPQWVEDAVLSMVTDERERVVSRIVGSYPKLTAHREWLRGVVLELLKLIEPDDNGDSVSDPPKTETSVQAQAGAGGS